MTQRLPMTDAPTVPAPSGSLLVLDDDEMVGILVETVARLAGMATRRALSCEVFFAEIAAHPPSHVLVDLTMPGMPGEDVLRQLAALQCKARVIVCSGAEPDRLSAATALAASLGLASAGSLPKPFSPVALRKLLGAP
jgi:DNA-binding response OmpR family regulator